MRLDKRIDPDRLNAARRLHARGELSDAAFTAWGMAGIGITHRDIAMLRRKSKGTVTEQITRANRLIDQELTCESGTST